MVFDSSKLLAEARQGNRAALGELLDHYRPYLIVLAQRYLDNRLQGRLDSADVAQVTFMEAHRDFAGFRGEEVSSLLAWLRNILQNNVATAHQRHLYAQKRTARKEIHFGSDSSSNHPGLAGLIPSETTSPSQRMMRDEAAAHLAICLQKLPDTQAEAIRLRYLEGFSLRQIAERMDKTEMAVAGLLKRGLRTLRDVLLSDSVSDQSPKT